MQIVFTSDLRFAFKIKPQSAHPQLPIVHLQWTLHTYTSPSLCLRVSVSAMSSSCPRRMLQRLSSPIPVTTPPPLSTALAAQLATFIDVAIPHYEH